MDLSAVIFVVLALAWAVYLIPKALQHHDEMAGDRLEQAHTEKVRVLSRQRRREVSAEAEPDTVSDDPVATEVETETEVVAERIVEAPVSARRPTPLPTRASARRAARNRRRVLAVLLLATIATGVCAWYAVVPAWAPAIPGALVVAFLVVARMSVRRMQAARRTPVPRAAAPAVAATASPVPATVEEPAAATAMTERLAEPELSDAERRDLEAALADDGSLWDPLPMTLPTYVGKARARRTVRTIELTGMTSSGHDAADTTLAREAREAEVTASAEAEATPAERRKAAGA